MAYDFPSSPTDGQVSGPYYWSASKGAWRVTPTTVAKTIMSPTAPTGASEGDQWQNTNDGSLFIRWNDGTSTQWVESRAPITADGYTSPNYLINGAFDIWQRGTSLSQSGGGVGVDMWREYTDTGSGTQSKDTSVTGPSGVTIAQQSYKFTAGGSATNWTLFQIIETLNAANLAGKTVTLSAYMSSSAARNFSMTMAYSTSVDAAWTGTWVTIASTTVAVGTSMSRVSATFVVPAAAKTVQVGINTGGTNLSAGATVNVAGVQLEEGLAATQFRRNANSVQGELAACQRYYQQFDFSGYFSTTQGLMATKWSGGDAIFTNLYIATMRSAPTVTKSSSSTARFVSSAGVVDVTSGTIIATQQMLSLSFTNNSLGAGFGWIDRWCTLLLSSEL